VDVEVTHRGKRPVVSLRLEDLGPDHVLRWFVPWLRRGESVRYRREVFLPHRGWYAWEPLRAVSGYPFGLAEGVVSTEPVAPVLVYPQLGRLHHGRLRHFLHQAMPALGRSRRRPVRHPTAQSEIHGVRPFRSGDSPRWIHWRTTARRGELMVRE